MADAGTESVSVCGGKLDDLVEQESRISDLGQRYQMRRDIEEAQNKIAGLGG